MSVSTRRWRYGRACGVHRCWGTPPMHIHYAPPPSVTSSRLNGCTAESSCCRSVCCASPLHLLHIPLVSINVTDFAACSYGEIMNIWFSVRMLEVHFKSLNEYLDCSWHLKLKNVFCSLPRATTLSNYIIQSRIVLEIKSHTVFVLFIRFSLDKEAAVFNVSTAKTYRFRESKH